MIHLHLSTGEHVHSIAQGFITADCVTYKNHYYYLDIFASNATDTYFVRGTAPVELLC
jgi:hypothetical protein